LGNRLKLAAFSEPRREGFREAALRAGFSVLRPEWLKLPMLACLLALLLWPGEGRAALFGEFSLKDEMDMGRQFEVAVSSALPLVEDPEIKLYVQSLVDRIVATLPPQPYSFKVGVVRNNALNAFAAPGGFIFVHTGMIQHLSHESELAGVLAHEIAHVTQRHIARRIERGNRVSLASLAGAILGVLAGGGGDASGAAVTAATAAGQAAMLGYSRADESEADQFGIQYLIAAGFNPSGLSGAFGTIREMSWGRDANFPAYLSTHPDITSRLAALSSRIQAIPAEVRGREDDDARFRRVRTLVWAYFGDPQYASHIFDSYGGGDPLRHLGRAILAARRNQVRDAEAAFAEALRLAPEDPLILRESGIFHYNKGDPGEARQRLERGLALSPDDYLGRFFYARLLDDEGDRRGAQESYRRVLRHVPEDAEVHSHYGRSLGQSRQFFAGYLHLAYAALYSNDEPRARAWLGKAAADARTPEEREDLARFEEKFQTRKKILDGK
jgi:predicted Zn-dependent protease